MKEVFLTGYVIGFLSAGFIGVLIGRIRFNRTRMGERRRPLDTFPDALQPNLTPIGIVRRSIGAMVSCLIFVVFLIIFIYLSVYIYKNWVDVILGSIF